MWAVKIAAAQYHRGITVRHDCILGVDNVDALTWTDSYPRNQVPDRPDTHLRGEHSVDQAGTRIQHGYGVVISGSPVVSSNRTGL
ncbi:MAG TPA: hypothetical protein VGC99_15105 [Candidatus Tectomicrobia bacterium]